MYPYDMYRLFQEFTRGDAQTRVILLLSFIHHLNQLSASTLSPPNTEPKITHLSVTQWKPPTLESLKQKESLGITLEGTPRYNYAFRGDTRNPDEIFEKGFDPSGNSIHDIFVAHFLSEYITQDQILMQPFASMSGRVVPISSNLQSAAIFATAKDQSEGWVYFVETKRAYNIATDSILMQRHAVGVVSQGPADYLNESVVSHIDPDEIICAIKIKVNPILSSMGDYHSTEQPPEGSFTVVEIRMNPKYFAVKKIIPLPVAEYIEHIRDQTFNFSLGDPEMMSKSHAYSRRKLENIEFWKDWPSEGEIEWPKDPYQRVVILRRLARTQREVTLCCKSSEATFKLTAILSHVTLKNVDIEIGEDYIRLPMDFIQAVVLSPENSPKNSTPRSTS